MYCFPVTVLKVTEKLDSVMRSLVCARAALLELKKHVTQVYFDKLEICVSCENHYKEMIGGNFFFCNFILFDFIL